MMENFHWTYKPNCIIMWCTLILAMSGNGGYKHSFYCQPAFLKVQKEYGSFDKYIWQFVDGKPTINNFKNLEDLPPKTIVSERLSKDLKKWGFKFVGPTIIYAHMQAIGLVNDHLQECFRYKEINQNLNMQS